MVNPIFTYIQPLEWLVSMRRLDGSVSMPEPDILLVAPRNIMGDMNLVIDVSATAGQAVHAPPRLASHQPGTTAVCSVMQPRGDGVRDVSFILQPPTNDLSQWYDTYDGHDALAPDWYALYFPQPSEVNTIFFVHGPMVPVGGWWKTLQPQYLDAVDAWQSIPSFTITPSYNFEDKRGNRQPFEPFQITFPALQTRAVRLFGAPGGSLGVTTIAYLAAGLVSAGEAATYLQQLRQPTPHIFKLLPANRLWDLLDRVRDVTQIAFDVQSREGLGLDHFLDEERFNQFHAQSAPVYDQTSLYQLLGMHEGWQQFGTAMQMARRQAIETQRPVIKEHHGNMVWIVIPVEVNGVVLGTLENRNLICRDQIDAEWHALAPQRLGIDPQQYGAALREIPVIAAPQLEAIVQLLLQIVNLSQEQIRQSIEVTTLQSTVEELAVPILPVWDGVLSVPLIGHIDEQRAQQINGAVLQQIGLQRSRTVIIDVTGVPTINAHVAEYIVHLAQSMHLLGTTCFLSGVRPDVAMTLVSIGTTFANIRTFANLQTALAVAIGK